MEAASDGQAAVDAHLERRIVDQERLFWKEFIRLIAIGAFNYLMFAGFGWWHAFAGDPDGGGPKFGLTLEPVHAAGFLGFVATLVVATNVVAWLRGTSENESWKWFARQRYARWGNSLLGVIAVHIAMAAIFFDAPRSLNIGMAIVVVGALVVVGIAVDASLAINPKSGLQVRVRRLEITSEILRLDRNALDRASSAALSRRRLAQLIAADLILVVLLTAVPTAWASGLSLALSGNTVDAYTAGLRLLVAVTVSIHFAVYAAYFSRLMFATRNFGVFVIQLAVGALVFSVAMLSGVEALWTSDLKIFAARVTAAALLIFTPFVLIMVGSNKKYTLRFAPRSPRILIDRAVDRAIEKLEDERKKLDSDVVIRGSLLLPSSITTDIPHTQTINIRTVESPAGH